MAKFVKGQSGNPNGRPSNGHAVTPMLRKLLAEKRSGKTRAEHVAEALITLAEGGDVNAIKVVLERADGKVAEPIDVTSGGRGFAFTIDLTGNGEDDASDG